MTDINQRCAVAVADILATLDHVPRTSADLILLLTRAYMAGGLDARAGVEATTRRIYGQPTAPCEAIP